MIIIKKKKTIFIHIHRTGGSSMISLLKKALPNQVDIIAQHGNASTMEGKLLQKYPDYFIFSMVRNPWDRILSWYSLVHKFDVQDIATERLRFEEYMISIAQDDGNDSFLFNQLDYFENAIHTIQDITIYRYEHYENEVQKIAKQLDIHIQEIPRVNNTKAKKYSDYYTEKSKALVAEKCARDIDYFGYSF
ncbi:sulfotransferase family 2 domain-containing protein [uncultured Dokdonia sp.]|uniref:sulfotransferase family 2 domain-containing protein n=1 Tax=uncultured Dokdonia sp. TaxID=575653 RepID=UPI002611B073|nr:sulfotransferase family 2 domain-containing protein [uncultured Dokdonia sp.]